jgi:hypothetical protein
VTGLGSFRGSWVAWLWLAAAGMARADAPAQTPPPPPPDASLIEFLGSDDTGDAKWWEFLKRTQPKDDTSTDSEPGKDEKR